MQTQLRQRAVAGLAGVLQVQVPDHWAGVLCVDGKVERAAARRAPTRSGSSTATSRSKLVDLRLQAVEVTGQDILTRDKVALRLNLSATLRFTDVLTAYKSWPSPRTTCTASCSSACARRWAPGRSTSCWGTRR